jgi:hypothetical protein
MAGGDVPDVDDVERALDVGAEPAEQESPQQSHRRPGRIVGTEDEGRVDEYERQAPRRRPQALYLGLVLRVDVGDAEVPELESSLLVGRAPSPGGPDRRHRRRVHRPLDPGAERLLEHGPGAADVGLEHRLAVGRSHRRPAGGVEDAVDPTHRPADRAAVGYVPGRDLDVEARQVLGPGRPPDEEAKVIAAVGERPQ